MTASATGISRMRLVLGAAGVLLGLFGVFRLLTEVPTADLVQLAIWLVAALILHDGVLSPVVVGIGWLLARYVPPRGRRFLQVGLVTGALISAIALPMIYRQDSQPASKGILRQDYGTNLLIALSVVAAVVVIAYLVSVVKQRPDAVHDSPSE